MIHIVSSLYVIIISAPLLYASFSPGKGRAHEAGEGGGTHSTPKKSCETSHAHRHQEGMDGDILRFIRTDAPNVQCTLYSPPPSWECWVTPAFVADVWAGGHANQVCEGEKGILGQKFGQNGLYSTWV